MSLPAQLCSFSRATAQLPTLY